jgi:hypothetical protein
MTNSRGCHQLGWPTAGAISPASIRNVCQLWNPKTRNPLPVASAALGVDALSGLFGIGGGFLIVPGLLFSTGMPMICAIGSSLLAVGAFGLTTRRDRDRRSAPAREVSAPGKTPRKAYISAEALATQAWKGNRS